MWEELSVDNTWDVVCTIKNFFAYIPDEWNQPKKVERSFYWGILGTLANEYVLRLIT
jgi:hypothetical protein